LQEVLLIQQVNPTGGLFVSFGGDDEAYKGKFQAGCRKAGIKINELTSEEALKIEPNLNSNIESAFEVDDGVVDPFMLTVANAYAARENKAEIETYSRVVKIAGRELSYLNDNKKKKIKADIIVNATGVWAGKTAKLVGREIKVKAYKGTILVYQGRAVERVVNHLHFPSQGDIILPHRNTTLVGTTNIPEKNLERFNIEKEEVDFLKEEGFAKVPLLRKRVLLRAYAGLRPVVGEISTRSFVLSDDGNFITISGGKLTTYRLMAEKVGNLVARKLGVRAKCRTAEENIIGDVKPTKLKKIFKKDYERIFRRYGNLSGKLSAYSSRNKRICLCEGVTSNEILFASKELFCKNLRDIRRRTRFGMGFCQGRRCTFEAALTLFSENIINSEEAQLQIINSLEERWKGIVPVIEDYMSEAKLLEATYSCTGNYNMVKNIIRR